MILSAASLLAFAQAVAPVAREAQLPLRIAYVPVLEGTAEPAAPPPPVIRAIAPLDPATDTALGEDERVPLRLWRVV